MWLLYSIPLGALLFYCGCLYLRQSGLIFRPVKRQASTPLHIGLRYEDVILLEKDETRVCAWWIPAENATQAVLYFYGTIGNMSYELRALQYLLQLGVNVLVADYPGYGKSTGCPSQQGCYRTADAAWNFVRFEKAFSADRTFLYGRSLGSAMATYLASKEKCGGLVFHSGFTSVPDVAARMYPYLPVRYFCHTKMVSLKLIANCSCPVLVLHSAADEFIPVSQGQRIYERAPSPKRYIAVRGGHLGDEWQLDGAVREAWKQILSGRTDKWEGRHNGSNGP